MDQHWGWFFECEEWRPIDAEYFVSTYRKWLYAQNQILKPTSKEIDAFRAGEADVAEEQSDEWSKDPILSHSHSGDDTDLELKEVAPAYWETHQTFLELLENDDNSIDRDFVDLFGSLSDLTEPQRMKIKYLISSQVEYETCRYGFPSL